MSGDSRMEEGMALLTCGSTCGRPSGSKARGRKGVRLVCEAAREQLAGNLETEGSAERCLSMCAKAIFAKPEEPSFFMVRAEAFEAVGDIRSALANFRKVLSLDPDSTLRKQKVAALEDAMGTLFFDQGDLVKALGCFERALALEKRQASYWVHVALVHLRRKDLGDALEALTRALDLDSSSADRFVLRGKVLWKMGLGDQATKDIKRARDINPFHPEISKFESMLNTEADEGNASASKLMMMGKHAEALKLMESALRVAPNDVGLLLLASTSARHLDHLAQATCFLDRAQEHALQREQADVDKQRALVLNEHALRLMQGGNSAAALLRLTKAVELYDRDAMIFVNRGDCFRAAHQLDAAERDYKRALDLDPNNPIIHKRPAIVSYCKGQEAFNAGRYSGARELFSQAIQLDPSPAEYFVNRGLALAMLNDLPEAFADFQHALRLDPSNTRARSWLASNRQLEASSQGGLPTQRDRQARKGSTRKSPSTNATRMRDLRQKVRELHDTKLCDHLPQII